MGKGSRKKKPRQKIEVRQLGKQRRHVEASGASNIEAGVIRPTPERLKRGEWRIPKGLAKHTSPAVDLRCDVVGLMYEEGFITSAQEQAARSAQQAWEGYIRELGLSQGRSCLDMSPVGYDDGEGDPEALAAWRNIAGKLSYHQEGALMWTVINGQPPANMNLLRSALDVVAGVARPKNIAYTELDVLRPVE